MVREVAQISQQDLKLDHVLKHHRCYLVGQSLNWLFLTLILQRFYFNYFNTSLMPQQLGNSRHPVGLMDDVCDGSRLFIDFVCNMTLLMIILAFHVNPH